MILNLYCALNVHILPQARCDILCLGVNLIRYEKNHNSKKHTKKIEKKLLDETGLARGEEDKSRFQLKH